MRIHTYTHVCTCIQMYCIHMYIYTCFTKTESTIRTGESIAMTFCASSTPSCFKKLDHHQHHHHHFHHHHHHHHYHQHHHHHHFHHHHHHHQFHHPARVPFTLCANPPRLPM